MDDQGNDQSLVERMVGFLDAEAGVEPEEKDPEQQEADEPEHEEVESEVTDEEGSQEEPEPPRKLKLTHNGEEIEKDEAEVITLAQQGFDYTQKTQKLAEERKAVEMQTQAIKAQEEAVKQQAETQQALIKEIAEITSIDKEMARYQAVDWNALSESDPVQTQKLWIQYQTLQNNRTQALNDLNQKHQQLAQQRALQTQTRLAEAQAELLKAFPNWNADMAKDLRETGKTYGFSEQELSAVTDPRTVKLLADAAAYRKLQAQKGSVEKKVQGKPAVVKPGTKDTQSANRSKTAEMRQQLRKTGDQHLAAKLIERML